MKIIYKQGDLLECTEDVIVHGCNAQGAMGSGVALAIRKRYPEAAKAYFNMKQQGGWKLGGWSQANTDDGKTIINAITQQFYGRNPYVVYVDYGAVAHIFKKLNEWAVIYGVKSIAMPKIGAGLANGDWNIIEKIVEEECVNVQPVVYTLE